MRVGFWPAGLEGDNAHRMLPREPNESGRKSKPSRECRSREARRIKCEREWFGEAVVASQHSNQHTPTNTNTPSHRTPLGASGLDHVGSQNSCWKRVEADLIISSSPHFAWASVGMFAAHQPLIAAAAMPRYAHAMPC